jgi:hypothetical protein
MPFLLYWFPRVMNGWEDKKRAGEDPLPQLEPGVSHGDARSKSTAPSKERGSAAFGGFGGWRFGPYTAAGSGMAS